MLKNVEKFESITVSNDDSNSSTLHPLKLNSFEMIGSNTCNITFFLNDILR